MLPEAPPLLRFVHETSLGPMLSAWSSRGLFSLRWDSPAANHPAADHPAGGEPSGLTPQGLNPRDDDRAAELDDGLAEYFRSGRVDFGAVELDSSGWTDFTQHVYRCCREITPGTRITYGELARRAGRPTASRAVGAAMSRNRVLLVIPCHRVVSAGGDLRGFSAPGGLQTKQFLLDLEAR